MIENDRVVLPIRYKKDEKGNYKPLTSKATRAVKADQYIFAEFLNGRAGYLIRNLYQFNDLLKTIRYTNISMCNANFRPEASCSNINDSVLLTNIRKYLEDRAMVVYLVPMDDPGNYSVDSEFICSVSEILGPKKLSTIKRLEYNLIPVKDGNVRWERLEWRLDSTFVDSYPRVRAIVPRESMNPHPAFSVFCEPDAYFLVEPFDKDTIGAVYMSKMITMHQEYINNMRPVITGMFDWAGNLAAMTDTVNTDTRAKIQAIVVWILHARLTRMILHVTTQEAIKQLMEMVAFTNVVYTGEIPTLPDNKNGYAFIDNQGMIQLSDTTITGYTVVASCDEAIKLIYETIKEYCILPGGVNMLGACNYPFMDNVPSIFWNGRQYND